MIGGLIMMHSDDTGLVLPPMIAPTQVIVVPIFSGNKTDDKVLLDHARKLLFELQDEVCVSAEIDESDDRAGAKFFKWERQGIPIRLEIGPKDLIAKQVVLVRRDTGAKQNVPYSKIGETIIDELETMQMDMLKKAQQLLKKRTKSADKWNEFVELIESGHFVMAHWCGDAKVEREIQEKTGATIRCIPFKQKAEKGKCILTGKPSTTRVVFAKAY
jgi:prolyl-tRNA synthetase